MTKITLNTAITEDAPTFKTGELVIGGNGETRILFVIYHSKNSDEFTGIAITDSQGMPRKGDLLVEGFNCAYYKKYEGSITIEND